MAEKNTCGKDCKCSTNEDTKKKIAILEANLETVKYEYEKLNSVYLDFVERSKDDSLKMNHQFTLTNQNLNKALELMNKMFDNITKNNVSDNISLSDTEIDNIFKNANTL